MKKSTIEKIIKQLNDAGVKYIVVGGIAVVYYGYLRFTSDLDLIVDLEEGNIRRTISALENIGYKPRIPVDAKDFANDEIRNSWVKEKNMIVFSLSSEIYPETPVDIFANIPFNFTEEYERVLWIDIDGGTKMPIISIKKLLELKTKAGRDIDKIDIIYLNKIINDEEKFDV